MGALQPTWTESARSEAAIAQHLPQPFDTAVTANKSHRVQHTESKLDGAQRSVRAPLSRYLPSVLLVSVGLWAYWPTLVTLAEVWQREPDYSHGFLVPLVALGLLWLRRASCPVQSMQWSWWGLLPLAISLALRYAGATLFIDACDGWALVFWIGGLIWLLGGTPLAWWASPAICFLLFMVPLPFRLEFALSQPLQRLATVGSVWCLQTLGQPAIAEGNVILL
ncbi:MAG TPA: exosortase/archaeosortase family protein, partial [Pirellulaceae bacterium]|nr:exosortase/archaeosortase family protein [Pirellulaceae bacterium]